LPSTDTLLASTSDSRLATVIVPDGVLVLKICLYGGQNKGAFYWGSGKYTYFTGDENWVAYVGVTPGKSYEIQRCKNGKWRPY